MSASGCVRVIYLRVGVANQLILRTPVPKYYNINYVRLWAVVVDEYIVLCCGLAASTAVRHFGT